MKKITLILLSLFCNTIIMASENPQLPVLRVNFNGQFTQNMSYINGNMSLTDTDGSVINLPAKFKTRGATALNYSMKPSFNMKLRATDDTEIDTTLCGLRSCSSWILDAMAIDSICMRNRVAFDVWNAFSKLPYETSFGSRNGTVGKFVEVYINDEYKGIFCLTDRINRKLLKLKKIHQDTDSTYTVRGVLYKQGTTDIADQTTLGYFLNYAVCVIQWHDAWELTEPEDYACEQAWEPLQTSYKNFQDYAYVKENYYTDNIADYTLFLMVMSIEDNWGNKNKYLSVRNIQSTGDTTRFVYTPWDLDTSLGNGIYWGGTYNNWEMTDIIKTAVAPFSTCLSQQEFMNLLADKWKIARTKSLSVDSVAQRLRNYRDLFINSGAWARQSSYFDAQKYRPCYAHDLSTEIEYIISWYKNRVNEMDTFLGITDNIATINRSSHPAYHSGIFDISGKKITNSVPNHIYIINGKKLIK